MRPVWYFDGAGLLCIYAEDKPEYLDCLIRGGADGVRFYAFYLVENRNTRCDSGLFLSGVVRVSGEKGICRAVAGMAGKLGAVMKKRNADGAIYIVFGVFSLQMKRTRKMSGM